MVHLHYENIFSQKAGGKDYGTPAEQPTGANEVSEAGERIAKCGTVRFLPQAKMPEIFLT